MKRDFKWVAGVIVGLVVVVGLGFGAEVARAAEDCPYDCGDVCAALAPEGEGYVDAQAALCDAADLAALDAEAAADAATAAETAAEVAAAEAAAAASTVVSTSTSSTTTSTSSIHTLSNPLGSTDFRKVIGYIIKALLGLSGAIALFVFVWSGIMMMLAAGSPEKIKKAKESLTWATIGLVVIFTAYTLVYTLITALSTGTTA